MKNLRETFRDMTPDEMREASREEEIDEWRRVNRCCGCCGAASMMQQASPEIWYNSPQKRIIHMGDCGEGANEMAEIVQSSIKLSQNWGVQFGDYVYDGGKFDLQDLAVAVAERRATSVEGEVAPLATRIQNRNKTLEDLGNVLADLTKLQSQFPSDAKGSDRKGSLQQSSFVILQQVFGTLDFSLLNMTKYEVEEWLQKVKSKIDALNNEGQKDMTRLQSLVDRRDEAYSAASDLMSEISNTRSNLIRNM